MKDSGHTEPNYSRGSTAIKGVFNKLFYLGQSFNFMVQLLYSVAINCLARTKYSYEGMSPRMSLVQVCHDVSFKYRLLN